jgi:predicted Zn-dependent protease with MMP-like domain
MLRMSRREFERTVARAVASIPADLRNRLENLVVTVEDEPSAEEIREAGLHPDEESLFGLYHGVPYGERGWDYGGMLPDRIVIYRRPLLAACDSRAQLLDEIRLTVIHEIGHFFGFEDDQLP